MFTYASLVWWPKTKEKTAQAAPQKIQRLAYLSITGAVRTCPTAAIGVTLDLIPLYMHTKKDAMLSALRLSRNKIFKPEDLVGHLNILNEIPWNSMITTMSDKMPIKLNFDHPFKVLIPERAEWSGQGPNVLKQSLNSGTRMPQK